MLYIGPFLANHVHMTLQNNGWCILIAVCCWFINDYIVHFILHVVKTMFFCKSYQIIADLFGVSGTVWDFADFLKIIKYFLWLHIF